MNAELSLTLPEPPSANRYWRHAKGRTYLSAEAKSFRLAVGVAVRQIDWPLFGPFMAGDLGLTYTWYRGRKSGDLDNRTKQLLDALQGCVYTDDSQIIEIHAYRKDAPRCARVDVCIYHATAA